MTRSITYTLASEVQCTPSEMWPTDVFHRVATLCPSVDEQVSRPRWLDHQNVETTDGTTLYVCHPYELRHEAWVDFLALEDAGYRVRVTGESDYLPGRTIRVEVHLPEGYAEGRAAAAREIRELVESEISMYRDHTPEQTGKINALNLVLEHVDRIGDGA